MFVGQATHTMNKDGRVSIPSKMRDVIQKKYDADDLYLVLMPGNVVCLYPGQKFEELAAGWLSNPEGASLQDIMEIERLCADAEPCKLDGSGRIVVSPLMREAAGIDQEVLVVGALTHIEIWNPQLWGFNRGQSRAGLEKFKSWPARTGVGQ